jgi:nucleotide-binding universal stress UspA family protein
LHVVPEEEFEMHKKSTEVVTEFRDYSFSQVEDSAARFPHEVVEQTHGEFEHQLTQTGGVGEPAEEILAEADAFQPRYLVIGGRRRSLVGKAIFGSTTRKIFLNASCPNVIIMIGGTNWLSDGAQFRDKDSSMQL